MPYATADDIAERLGPHQWEALADRAGDGTIDAEAVDRALADADALIDAHVGAQHALPLVSVPTLLGTLAVDIAIWRLAQPQPTQVTEERRQGYQDALALLKRIADGTARLPGVVDPVAGNQGSGTAVVPGPVSTFGRGML